MIKRTKVKKDMTARRLSLAFVVLATLIIVVQVGSAAPRERKLDNSPNSVTPIETSLLPTAGSQGNQRYGWKEYSDSEFGFAISYPNEWQVEDFSRSEDEKDPLKVLSFRPQQVPSILEQVDAKDRSANSLAVVAVLMVIPDPMETVAERIVSYDMVSPSRKIITVNGASGIKIEGESLVWDTHKNRSTTEHRIVYLFPQDSNTITFSFTPKPVNSREDYSAILSEMSKSLNVH